MYPSKNTLFLFFLSFSSFLLSMEEAPKKVVFQSIPKELIQNMMPGASIPTCGALGRVCHCSRQDFHHQIICKDPTDPKCSSPMCVYLSHKDNFDAGTKALAFYAREYKKDPDNKYAYDMFYHLLNHQKGSRIKAIRDVLGEDSFEDDCINIYAGEYEKNGRIESHSAKLTTFFVEGNVRAAKMMLLSPVKYEFGYDTMKALIAAYKNGDFDIMDSLAKIGYVLHVAELIISHGTIDLLRKFIHKHYEQLFEHRYDMWGHTCFRSIHQRAQNRKSYSRPIHLLNKESAELDYTIFQEIIALLFSGREDVQNNLGTLLHEAIMHESEVAVDYLIENNFDINVLTKDNYPLLHHAHKCPKIMKSLLAAGAKVDARSAYGSTALMSALGTHQWDKDVIKSINLLLDYGADVNAVDNCGCSPLHYCVIYSNWKSLCDLIPMVTTLIEQGADITLKDDKGKTAYDYAKEQGKDTLMQILIER